MSKSHSRRAFLAGCAIMPAAALAPAMPAAPALAETAAAAIAAKPAEPDPILAAIAESRRIWAQYLKANRKFDNAKCEAWQAGNPKPSGVIDIAWRKYILQSYSELADARAELLGLPGADPEIIEREYHEARAQLRAGRRAEREWYKRNGLTELKTESDRLNNAERKALWALTKIKPTTPAGAGALVAYVHEDMKDGNNSWQLAAIAHAAKALKEMEPPPAGIPKIAAPALALSGPDPIFAAIENHKGLNAAFSRTLLLKDTFDVEHGFSDTSPQHDDLVRREDETGDAEREACDEMLATVPTTFAGVLALLRYVEQEKGEFLDESAFKELLSTTVSVLERIGVAS